jgi:hypothetical protein
LLSRGENKNTVRLLWAGRQVRDLAGGMTAAGEHAVAWDLRDVAGQRVSRGLYFARLVVNGEARSQTVAVSR